MSTCTIRNYPEFGERPFVTHSQKATSSFSRLPELLKVILSKISQIAKSTFRFLFHAYRLHFQPGVNNALAPRLGQYVPTDVRISNHATESQEWKKQLIASARKSIELSGNFAGGEVFREVLDLIEYRMQKCPELKAHILVSPDLLETKDLAKLKQLKEHYSNQFVYLTTSRIFTIDPKPLSEENHVKLLIVDEQYFVTGGTGIHDKMYREVAPKEVKGGTFYSKFVPNCFKDADLIGKGDVAKSMRNQFFNLYRIWEYRMTGSSSSRYFPVDGMTGTCCEFEKEENLIRNVNLKFIISGPEHRKHNPITHELIALVDQAQSKVKIASLNFNPDSKLKKALQRCKKTGVKINGYLNGCATRSLGVFLSLILDRAHYHLLSKAYEYKGKDQLYHKKVMTIDDRISVIGSYNLGIKSAFCDYEIVVVMDDPRVTQVFNDSLKLDGQGSQKIQGKKLDRMSKLWRTPGFVMKLLLGPFCA